MDFFTKLAGFKVFAARVLRLSAPYFQSQEKWRARALFAAIVALNLGSVFMAVLFNDWYGVFYDALQNKDEAVFWSQIVQFAGIALAAIIIAVYRFYLTQLLEMNWRKWMTGYYLSRWLAGNAFYRLELGRFLEPANGAADDAPRTDNPDQRIAEDVNQFTAQSVSLTMGLLNASVTLASFVGILWALSGAFAFDFNGSRYAVPGFMVWMALLYCLCGSVITHYIGRPQIALNFEQQRREADFRHQMVRVREYSEAIALDRGQAVEQSHLQTRFAAVLANYIALIRAQKSLIWFTSFFGQAAVVFPMVVAAPRFFSGAIQLGDLMKINSAFGRVQDALSWFIDNYANLAAWRATTDRLTGFDDAISAATRDNPALAHSESAAIDIAKLNLALPGGALLLSHTSVQAQPGARVLLHGPSGSGKSTLFRALAGIWPFASGAVARNHDAMFIPQHPYFPDTSLRDALAYPEPASRYQDATMVQALNDALLPALATQLDRVDAWSQKLSGGERQRLAIARVLLKQPAWVYADEATSALDAPTEDTLYRRLFEMVQRRGGGIVSISHRASVAALHTQRWELQPQAAGAPARFALRVDQ